MLNFPFVSVSFLNCAILDVISCLIYKGMAIAKVEMRENKFLHFNISNVFIKITKINMSFFFLRVMIVLNIYSLQAFVECHQNITFQ